MAEPGGDNYCTRNATSTPPSCQAEAAALKSFGKFKEKPEDTH